MDTVSHSRWNQMSDEALLRLIGNFIRKNRLNQNKSQEETALAAGLSRSTLSLLEKGEKVKTDSLLKVLRVLNLLYVMDIFKTGEVISPLEYAGLRKKVRKQASPKRVIKPHQNDLGW